LVDGFAGQREHFRARVLVTQPAKASAGCPAASFNCGSSLPQELRTTS
jgi:hypothetical protein